jgi:hypothetical protein
MQDDRDIWQSLFRVNHKLNKIEFAKLEANDKRLEDRISTIEDVLVAHTRRSSTNAKQLHLLMAGMFVCFFLLGFSIEGSVGNSKISYSSSGLTQIILQIFSVGGLAVAIAQHPSVRKLLSK